MFGRERVETSLEVLGIHAAGSRLGFAQFFRSDLAQRLDREFASSKFGIHAVSNDSKCPAAKPGDVEKRREASMDGHPGLLEKIIRAVGTVAIEQLSSKGLKPRRVEQQEFPERRIVSDLTSEDEGLLINGLGRNRHVRGFLSWYAACRVRIVHFLWRFFQVGKGEGRKANIQHPTPNRTGYGPHLGFVAEVLRHRSAAFYS